MNITYHFKNNYNKEEKDYIYVTNIENSSIAWSKLLENRNGPTSHWSLTIYKSER